jgi:hypothetical protein
MQIDLTQMITAEAKAAATEAQRLIAARDAALRYLADTDWMVLRAAEPGGKPMPGDVAENRAAARVEAGCCAGKISRCGAYFFDGRQVRLVEDGTATFLPWTWVEHLGGGWECAS